MKRLCGMHVVRSRLHGSLELPKRIPPAPLLEIYAPKVHDGPLDGQVAGLGALEDLVDICGGATM